MLGEYNGYIFACKHDSSLMSSLQIYVADPYPRLNLYVSLQGLTALFLNWIFNKR